MGKACYIKNYKNLNLPFIIQEAGIQENQCEIVRHSGSVFHQLIFSIKGEGVLETKGETKVIHEGEVFYLNANEFHSYKKCNPSDKVNWKTGWIIFNGTRIEETLHSLGFDGGEVLSISAFIYKKFENLRETFESNENLRDYIASAQLYEILVALYQLKSTDKQPGVIEKEEMIKEVTSYIDKHYAEDISLEQLAKMTGLTPQYFCKLFKNSTKATPLEYIMLIRMRAAKRLLLNSSLSIKRIAEKVGYKDNSYFALVFKRTYGMTATQYRGF